MRIVVAPPELHAASGAFSQLAGEYSQVYQNLLNTANTMGSAWQAADNLAFVEQINGFCAALNKMVQHLEQASQALTAQANNYESARDHNVTSVRTLVN